MKRASRADMPNAASDSREAFALDPTLLDHDPDSSTATPLSGGVPIGALIGRYVVLATAGAGAMGLVLAAYDPQLDRKVALKLLKLRGRDQATARTRLQREAQALARLDHRNVVAVHDVGVHEGQLFVAMEFVEGQTLRAWLAEPELPRAWPELLRVLAEAGRGLAAAHEVGLVHRDFKPDNVMRGGDGRVRVMDFGLARTTQIEHEQTGSHEQREPTTGNHDAPQTLTATGTLLGTPAYMSPEQLDGEPADARSDQFSFCVALYEALYGERPFAGRTMMQLMHAIGHGRIQSAPQASKVPGWLRKVVLRGLSPVPSERWPSMQALLDALADDPRIRRRRRWAAAGLAGLLGGGAWGVSAAVDADARVCEGMEDRLAGAWDDERRAAVEAAILGTQLGYAPGTWERVEQRLDDYTQLWVAAREEACEATHRGEQSGELLDLRMACLDERLQHVRATVDVLARADETAVKKAVEAVAGLPRLERCADVDALTAEAPPPEDPQVAQRVAQLDERLIEAVALNRAGKYVEGLELADAVEVEAATLSYEPLQVRTWLRQGRLQRLAGEYEPAEATLERAYESAVGLGMKAEAAAAAADLVHVVGYKLARHAEGRTWAMHAKALARVAGTDLAWVSCLNSLSAVAMSEGKHEQARDYAERALTIQEKVFGPEHPNFASTLNNLGNLARGEGKYEQAYAYFERALAIRTKVLGPEHPMVAATLNSLGTMARLEGKFVEARGYHERALAIQEKTLGPEHPDVAGSLNDLAMVAAREGKHEQARDYAERALAIQEKVMGPEHPQVASLLNNLGVMASNEGKLAESRGYHERALAIQEKALAPEHPGLVNNLSNLGNLAHREGKYVESRGYHERALAIQEKAFGPDHLVMAALLGNLGIVAISEGKYEEARGYYERALAIREKALGPGDPGTASHLINLGLVLLGQAKPSEALPHLERALTLRTTNEGESAGLAIARFTLARALWEAPAKQGRDRARARSLAELARAGYADAGDGSAKALEEVEAWLAKHAAR